MTIRAFAIVVWSAAVLVFTGCQSSEREASASPASQSLEILQDSSDGEVLVTAALALARSDNPQDLEHLGAFLKDRGFLARLDMLGDPHVKTRHLGQILTVLAQRPRSGLTSFSLALADDTVFLSDPDRLRLLLPVLAADTPMTADAAALFRRTNEEGYFAFNAPLLAANASPEALALFVAMMSDSTQDVDRRVDCLHASIVPHRTRLPVLKAAEQLLATTQERRIRNAAVESIFDYRGKEWFGPATDAPVPMAWTSASNEVLQFVVHLAERLDGVELPDSLSATMRQIARRIQEELHSRR